MPERNEIRSGDPIFQLQNYLSQIESRVARLEQVLQSIDSRLRAAGL